MHKQDRSVFRNITFASIVIFAAAYVVTAQSDITAAPAVPLPVLTWHNDTLRTGRHGETILTLANVNPSNFGLKFVRPADGKVFAQPLYLPNVAIPGKGIHNIVFLATEHDTVYAYDADNAALLWQKTMLKAGEVPSDDRGCGQISPEDGITATPVIDPAS